jgi:MFS transporter, UMF1 family
VTEAAPAAPPAASSPAIPRRRVAAWALWDAGSAGINAITTTFVFSTFLVSSYFYDPQILAEKGKTAAEAALSANYGLGTLVTGIVVAGLAPALGALADSRGRRKLWLAVSTAMVVVALVALFFTVGQPPFFLYGLIWFGIGTVFYEIATVNYHAMLAQVSTPKNIGRVSALGWASGYLAGIVLLLLVYVGLIAGSGDTGGLLHVPTADGLNIRVVELVAAAWTLGFSIPVLVAVPEIPREAGRQKIGFFQSYGVLVRDIGRLWLTDRNTVLFLIASAVFRDGVTGVFQYGGILAKGTFGFSTGEVLIFGIAANVVAGVATISIGPLDDRLGPRKVMIISLSALTIVGLTIFLLHGAGQPVFWVGALILSVFVGPAQSASRTFLTRVTPPERQSEVFGLYATTGRAAIILAPALFTLFVSIFGAQYWGMLGIVIVIAVGLALLVIFVKPPQAIRFTTPEHELVADLGEAAPR